jgi:hypothetical protein
LLAELGCPNQPRQGFNPLLQQALETGQRPINQPSDQAAAQGESAVADPQPVGNVYEAGGASADPAGVFTAETFEAGDDEAALGGVVAHLSGHEIHLV